MNKIMKYESYMRYPDVIVTALYTHAIWHLALFNQTGYWGRVAMRNGAL